MALNYGTADYGEGKWGTNLPVSNYGSGTYGTGKYSQGYEPYIEGIAVSTAVSTVVATAGLILPNAATAASISGMVADASMTEEIEGQAAAASTSTMIGTPNVTHGAVATSASTTSVSALGGLLILGDFRAASTTGMVATGGLKWTNVTPPSNTWTPINSPWRSAA